MNLILNIFALIGISAYTDVFPLIFMHVALLVQHESDTGTSASRMQGTPTEQPQSGGNVCNSQGDNDRDPSLDSLLMHAYILLLPPQREVILITGRMYV